MKIIENSGICAYCKSKVEYRYGEENYLLKKKDLDNYRQYKDVYVHSCPMCNFVATNLTSKKEKEVFENIKQTAEFKDIYNYLYLKGLDKELYDNHSQEVPANYYESVMLSKLVSKDYEMAIRLLYKTAELKMIMARKYRVSKAELGGEEGNDSEYIKLDKLINKSIKQNQRQINIMYSLVKNPNIFLNLLYIENLTNMCNMAEAKREYAKLHEKTSISEDLDSYIKSKILV